MWLQRRFLRWAAAGAAVLVMSGICGCASSVSHATMGNPSASHLTPGNPITFSQFDSLQMGESQAQVVKQLGVPESRRRVVPYGFTHEEPKGQRCIYYRRRFPDAGDRWSSTDTFQLCFRGSRLRYRWAYIAARA
jgi:hypothetical protein